METIPNYALEIFSLYVGLPFMLFALDIRSTISGILLRWVCWIYAGVITPSRGYFIYSSGRSNIADIEGLFVSTVNKYL